MKIFKRLKNKLSSSDSNEKMDESSPSNNNNNKSDNEHSNEKKYNFKYLQDLIKNSSNEIKLNHDIVLGVGEETEFSSGIFVYCDIDGNGHTIDARGKVPIFNLGWERKEIIIKNLILKNGQASKDYSNGGCICCGKSGFKVILSNCKLINNSANRGGAIYNEGILSITDCTFESNHANEGGAIYNESYNLQDHLQKLSVNNSIFKNNSSKNAADVIYNQVHEITITDCIFDKNTTKGMITNLGGSINIFNSKFLKNFNQNIFSSEASVLIINNSFLTIENSSFNDNIVDTLIYNELTTSISYVEFNGNSAEHIITNCGKSCIIKKVKFKSNITLNGSKTNKNLSINIYNQMNLTLENIEVDSDDERTIFNAGNILIKDNSFEIEKITVNKGMLNYYLMQEANKNFTFLDSLIHSGNSSDIILKDDISLSNNEIDFYEGGIELDIDGLVIDGNGHTIDGTTKSRIFLITGKNITIKNIIFINGHSFEDYIRSKNSSGGCLRIYPNSNLKIENCHFINNISEKHGGAIQNYGKLKLLNSELKNNSIEPFERMFDIDNHHYGGALYNEGKLTIDNTVFNNNSIKKIENDFDCEGGAIFNIGEATLSEAIINENYARQGGSIVNNGKMSIVKSSLQKNKGDFGFHGIKNTGCLSIQDSLLKDNVSEYKSDADAFESFSQDERVEIKNCKIE